MNVDSKLNKIQRMDLILKIINSEGFLPTKKLLLHFPGISSMTINRDLRTLLDSKLIVKLSAGYASIAYTKQNDKKILIKQVSAIEEKNLIAIKTIKYIEKNDIIFFSPGTTSEFVVEKIKQTCTIYSNSYKVFEICQNKKNIKAILIGGKDVHNKRIFTGVEAIKSVSEIQFDKVFLSVTGICKDGKLLNTNQEEALIETLAINNAKEIFIIADSSKINHLPNGNYIFSTLEKCDYLITDTPKKVMFHFPKVKVR